MKQFNAMLWQFKFIIMRFCFKIFIVTKERKLSQRSFKIAFNGQFET
jgi:hypothetical protein